MKKIYIYEGNKGITLIMLVVTIIVLIILAGVSIGLLTTNGGILERTKEQKEEQIKAQILEELELAKGPVTIDGEGYTSLKKYLEAIKDKKLANTYEVTSVEQIDEANAVIWIDGKYKYTAAQIGIDVIINEEGILGKLKPQIQSFTIVSMTSNSINVKVSARLAEEYEFYIGESKENYKKVKEINTGKKETSELETITYIYGEEEPLEEGKKYYLKVIARNDNGQVEKQIEKETIPIPTITVVDADIWTNKEKRVNISQVNGYTIKYTIDGTIPSESNGTVYTKEFTVSQNCTITAVYLDSTNQLGTVATNTITKIEKENPSANITISGSTTQASLPATLSAKVTHEDNESGVNTSLCKYVLNTTSTEIGTNENSYTGGTFSSKEQTITINLDSAANWYLHILTVDNAGNKKETIKGPIGVSAITHTHTGSWGGGGCYKRKCTNPSWGISGSIRWCNTCGTQMTNAAWSNDHYYLSCGISAGALEGYRITY